MTALNQFFSNQTLFCAWCGWFFAQLIKYILGFFWRKERSIRYFFASGGMPSSHSSCMVALTTLIGFRCGFDSELFAALVVVSMIVMYDAAGVRRETGRQGEALNSLFSLFQGANVDLFNETLKERVGHSPLQVLMGAILGVAIGLLFHFFG